MSDSRQEAPPPEPEAANRSNSRFVSTLILLVVLAIVFVAAPLSYLRTLPVDLWTLGILVFILLLFRRFLGGGEPPSSPDEEENWMEYSIGMVHEVKNRLMDFHPEHYGGPGGLADYLEGTVQVLEETVDRLREYERESSEEPGQDSSSSSATGSEEESAG